MEVASCCDVIYQTRIQRERFGDRVEDYAKARGKYIVDKRVMDALSPNAVIMHPLPRLDEVSCIQLHRKLILCFLHVGVAKKMGSPIRYAFIDDLIRVGWNVRVRVTLSVYETLPL